MKGKLELKKHEEKYFHIKKTLVLAIYIFIIGYFITSILITSSLIVKDKIVCHDYNLGYNTYLTVVFGILVLLSLMMGIITNYLTIKVYHTGEI